MATAVVASSMPSLTTAATSSSSGFVALLDDEPELKVYALENLNKLVDEFWAEIAFSVAKIETLAEDESFAARQLAALVASKVHYHLGEFPLAMRYALGAGASFDVFGKKDLFVETLVAKFVDEYIRLRVAAVEVKDAKDVPKIDPRLEAVVESMFERCFKDGDYRPALGIALESRRTDKFREAIQRSGDAPTMLQYAYKVCMGLLTSREYRHEVLQIVVDLHFRLSPPDYGSIVKCLVFLDDHKRTADILDTLVRGNGDDHERTLLAYQIAFDLCESSTQQFRRDIRESLPAAPSPPTAPTTTTSTTPTTPTTTHTTTTTGTASTAGTSDGAAPMQVDRPAATAAPPEAGGEDAGYGKRLAKLRTILTGEVTIGLYLEFLYRQNHTDLAILKNIKTAVESRNSVSHSATIFANAIMHAGTTRDTFLRENLEWLARAVNWAKFGATAGLGVIHKGHLKEGLSLLSPYLPQAGGASTSPYSEGGALYALGLIHASHGEDISKYLSMALRTASTAGAFEVLQHGGCLGLGLAAMATRDNGIYEQLREVMYTDSAVAGEAAGLAMGLVQLGSASPAALEDMLKYAHETQHEKIIRGLALGAALVMYGREEQADTLIEQLTLDKDPILRFGGMYTVALAYAGTGNNAALRRLLHVAVSDVSDDVRRAAVIAIGFLLFRQPRECPRLVSLLAASYNPHVRYGAALAVGIACAGTALREAVELLEPLAGDAVDFVRQGALIGLAMVLIQATKAQEPKVEAVRKMLEEKIADKHEETLCKFGAILATGILDAGGRNVTLSLQTRSGHSNLLAIVGVAVFTQFWYWFPLVHFISLALTPTAVLAVNKDLSMPKFQFRSNARPSLFAYPPDVKPPVKEAPKKVATAVLSTAAKAKARKDGKDAAAGGSGATPMEGVDLSPSSTTVATDSGSAEAGAGAAAAADGGKEKGGVDDKPDKKEEGAAGAATTTTTTAAATGGKKPEPAFEILPNGSRVTVAQARHISFDVDERYVPVKRGDAIGVLVLRDNKPGQPEELAGVPGAAATTPAVGGAAAGNAGASAPAATAATTSAGSAASGGGGGGGDKEPTPPAPFEFE